MIGFVRRQRRFVTALCLLAVSAYPVSVLFKHRNDVCFGAFVDEQFAERLGLTEQQAEVYEEFGGAIEEFCDDGPDRIALLPNMIHAETENAEGAWRDFLLMNADDNGVVDPANYRKALKQREMLLQARGRGASGPKRATADGSKKWEALGPINQPGRIQTLAIDPFNSNRILLGAAEAGLWISNDEGQTWTSSPALPNLPINSFAFSHRTPGLVYALVTPGLTIGGSRLPSNVIYKSVDSGASWVAMPGTGSNVNPALTFNSANALALSPHDDNVLLVTNFCSILRSADGGQTWTSVFSDCGAPAAGVTRMPPAYPRFDPTNPARIVVGAKAGVVVSNDAGQTWAKVRMPDVDVNSSVNPMFAASVPGMLYAISWVPSNTAANDGQLFKSTDGGGSWQKINTYTLAYSDYTNQLWVDPQNPNILVTGGIVLYRSTNGGVTLTRISGSAPDPNGNMIKPSALNSPHADIHHIFGAVDYNTNTNRKVFVASDSGVMMTRDIAAVTFNTGWVSRIGRLVTAQYYGIAASADGSQIYAGSQDHGLHAYRGNNTWSTPLNYTDFGKVQVDQTDGSFIYTTLPYLSIVRSRDGGTNWFSVQQGFADAGFGNFNPPISLDPTNQRRLYAGGRTLSVTADARADTLVWSVVKPAVASGSTISTFTISRTNGNTIWVGHNNGEIYFTNNALAATPTWTRVTTTTATRAVGSILIDAANPAYVYVGYQGLAGNNLIVTNDGGATWSNVEGGFPEVSVLKLIQDPQAPGTIYAGTNLGLYETANGGASWTTSTEGPDDTGVMDMAFAAETGDLIVATFSRGAFVLRNAITPTPVTRTPVRIGAVFSTTQPSARSFLRLYNSGVQAGTATITLSDGASGQQVARWTSPNIPPGVSQQFYIADPESAATSAAAKPQYYTVSVQSQFPGHFQHVLWRPSDGTLTNLSTCDSGVTANATRLTHVHTSRVGNVGYPSSIVVHNTSDSREVELSVSDADTGAFLGSYSTTQIPVYGEKIVSVAEIEAGAGITPTPSQFHYTISIASPSTGYIQHLVDNQKVGVVSDMSTVCALSPAPQPVDSLNLLRLGAVYAPSQGSAQSFLRVTNNSAAGGSVFVGMYDPATGRQIGVSGSGFTIPPGASEQVPMTEIERLMTKFPDANGSTTYALPRFYSLTISASFSGTFQHVLYKSADGTLTNLSTCNTGIMASPKQLTHVHSARVGDLGFPSSIVVHNTGSVEQRAALTIIDALNGTAFGTYQTAPIPANGEVIVSMTAIEAALNLKPEPFQFHYTVTAPAAFTGYLQHLVDNQKVAVITDMTTTCKLN